MDIFEGFDCRDEDLRRVKRYGNYPVMFYRTNLYTHSYRVAALVRDMEPFATKVFGAVYDSKKAEIMALVHDDAEIVFGDVAAGHKYKMTEAQLDAVKKAERKAIRAISKRFPTTVAGYNYEELLNEYEAYSSLEAQVVCYADKYDALGEALHEAYAGNTCLMMHEQSIYGETPTPLDYYTEYFANFRSNFPNMVKLLEQPIDIFAPINYGPEPYREVAKSGKLHTKPSILVSTGDFHYDNWKRIVLRCGNKEVIRDMYTQKEPMFPGEGVKS